MSVRKSSGRGSQTLAIDSSADLRTSPTRRRADARIVLPPVCVLLAGLVMRIGGMVASRGGLTGNYGYDPSVYYTAADAFTHGRMPYRDFVLLHPPGLMLVLSPFAALGRATTDLTGFVAGNVALATLGAVNGVLVYFVARRIGLSPTASWLGGMFYAVWYGAVYAEMSSRLEPLGAFAFLCGLFVLTGKGSTRRRAALAGVAFGCAVSVKIWWAVPLVIAAAWLVRSPVGRRRAACLLAGAFGALMCIDGPFFVLAPSQMWHMVVLDQLGRGSTNNRTARLAVMSTLNSVIGAHGAATTIKAVLFVGVFAALCVTAWRVRSARVLVAITCAQVAVLIAAPSFFHFYLDYLSPSLALVVAAAAAAPHRRSGRQRRPRLLIALVAAAATITASVVLVKPTSVIEPFPTDALSDTLPRVNCVMTITPMVLIELNVLSRDLGHDCAQWVDATGRTYSVDAPHGPRRVIRRHNTKWQADVRRYLMSGGAFVLVGDAGSLNAKTLRTMRDNRLLTRIGAISLYQPVRDRVEDSGER